MTPGGSGEVADRAAVEAALRTSEQRFRALIEHSHDGIVLFGADGSVLYASPSTTNLLGYLPEELYQRNALEFVHPDSQQSVGERLAQALRSPGAGVHSAAYVRHKDGSWRFLEGTFTNLLHEPGIGAIVNNFRDLTERRRAEQRRAAFATLGRRLNVAGDAAEAARIIVGIADELFGWDSCTLDLYDAGTDRCAPVLNVDVVNGQRQDVAAVYADAPPSPRMRRALEQGAELILRAEPLALTPDLVPFGDTRRPSASLMIVPVRERGQVVGVLSIQSYRLNAYTRDDLAALQDLADHCAGALERIGAQRALRASEERFARAFKASPAAVNIATVAAGRLIQVNDRYCQFFGQARAELIGRCVPELAMWEDPAGRARLLDHLRTHRSVRDYDARLRRRDGSVRDVIMSVELIDYPGEPEPALISMFIDITDRRQAEQRQAAFAALGRRLNAATDAAAAARIIVGIADDLFGWDSCKVDLYDAPTDQCRSILTVDVVHGQRQEVAPAYSGTAPSPRLRPAIEQGPQLILRQEPITLPPDSRAFGDTSRPSASMMEAPLREGGTVIGVLAIQSYRLNAYTRDDLAALQDLADHCAGALERIAAAEALRESERKLAEAERKAHIGYWDRDLAAGCITLSAEALRIFGLPPASGPVGVEQWHRQWLELVHPADRLAADRAVAEALRGGPRYDLEYRVVRPDGEVRMIHSQGDVTLDEAGRPRRMFGIMQDITGRKQAEVALRESEERLRLAVKASNLGLWDWDVRTNEVVFSREWKSQLGYAEDEIGNAFSEWESRVHPDDLAPTLERVRRALAKSEEVYEVEFRMRHKDGSWRWIYTRAEVFRDPQGQAVRLIGCHVDITERKRAEHRQAAFAALGRRLNAATDDTTAARIIVDTADELFGWDSCKVDFYDAQTDRSRSVLTVDVVNGQRQELSPALSDTLPSPRLRQVVTTGALLILRQEPVTLSPDSTPFGDKSRPSASIMAVPIREAGKIVGVLAIQSYRLNAYTNADLAALQDLADHCAGALERNRGRAELQQERNLLRTVVDHLPDFIYVKDLESRFVLFNAASLRLMKLEREEAVLGRTVFDFFPPEQARAFTEDDQRVLTSGQPVLDREEPITGQSGQTRHLLTTKVPLCDASGQVVGLVGLSHDITERKRAEEALRAAEEKYRSIFEHAVEGIYQSTPEGRYLTVNPAMAGIYGYASPEAMVREVTDIGRQLYAEPGDRRKLQALLHSQGGFGVFECLMRRRDGTLIRVRQSARAVRDAAGQVICYEGSAEDITERHQAAEALRRSQEQLKAIINSVDGIVWEADAETFQFTFVSPQAQRLLGYPPSRWLAEPGFWASHIHPEDREAAVRYCVNCTREQRDHEFEYRMLAADGREVWLRDVVTVVLDHGRLAKLRGIMLDITARKQAEAALHREHTLLTAVVEGTSDAVFAKDLAGRYLIINTAGAQALGRSAQKILGHTDAEFVPEATARRFREVDEAVVASGQMQTQEETGLMGGELRSWHANKAPLRDADGRIIGIVGVSRDITERKQAELELRASQQSLEKAQQVGHIGSWESDPSFVGRLKWSAETARIFGFAPGEFDGRMETFLALLHPEDRETVLRVSRAALAGEQDYDLEHRIVRRDGQTRWVHEQADVERNAAGQPVRMVGVVRDITERKQVEAELVQLSGKLLRAQDEERRRLARELHDSTAQTLAALAMNLAIVTRTTTLDAEGRALLAECEAQVKRGTTELRTFAYLLHPPALEALGLARAAQDYAEGFAKRSGIAVTLDVPDEPVRLPPEIELTLFRVLQESLGNLHRHSGSATATLRITHDAETIVLEVRDAGRGLDERQLAAARTGGSGLGVGFAGMRERLRLLGGRLELEPGLPGLIVRATLPPARGEWNEGRNA